MHYSQYHPYNHHTDNDPSFYLYNSLVDWKWQRIANFVLLQQGVTGVRGAVRLDNALVTEVKNIVSFGDLAAFDDSLDKGAEGVDKGEKDIDQVEDSESVPITATASVGAADRQMDINSCLECLSRMLNVTSNTHKLERLLQVSANNT